MVAVAARGLQSAEKFAKTHSIDTVYEGYDHLAKDDNVDIVYIGTINNVHFDMCMKGSGFLTDVSDKLIFLKKQNLRLSSDKRDYLSLIELSWIDQKPDRFLRHSAEMDTFCYHIQSISFGVNDGRYMLIVSNINKLASRNSILSQLSPCFSAPLP